MLSRRIVVHKLDSNFVCTRGHAPMVRFVLSEETELRGFADLRFLELAAFEHVQA